MMDKKINFKSLIIRLLISLTGFVFSEFGIGCYYGCGLGTDPISVFVDGIHQASGLTYGQISTICNVILFVLIFLFERKHLGISTLIGTIIAGPLIDFFETMIRTNFPVETTPIEIKILILLAGLITTGIGAGLCIVCKMGIGNFQFIPLFLADHTNLDLKYCQMLSDASFFIVGLLLGGVVGIGTVVGVLFTGYVLDWTIRKMEKYVDGLGPIFS